MQPEWTSFFSKLIRDYLAAADPVTSGIPAAATLPKVYQDETADGTMARLVVTAEQTEGDISRLLELTVKIELLIQTEKDSTAPVTASQWMGAVETRLRDLTAFSTWLTAQSEAVRTDWQFVKAPRVGASSMDHSAEDHTQSRTLEVQLRVLIERA